MNKQLQNFIEKISWEQISVVVQCTVRFTLLRQSHFDRRVHLKLFGTVTVLTENKNDFLTEGVMLLDNFRVLLLFLFTFWSIGWLSEVLRKSRNPIRWIQLEIMT